MGNIRSRDRPRPALTDSSTNTTVPYLFISRDSNEEIHHMQTRIDIITLRLEKAENDSQIAFEQLRQHNQRRIEAIDYYRRLALDITFKKECEIDELDRELETLKQKRQQAEKDSASANKRKSACW